MTTREEKQTKSHKDFAMVPLNPNLIWLKEKLTEYTNSHQMQQVVLTLCKQDRTQRRTKGEKLAEGPDPGGRTEMDG